MKYFILGVIALLAVIAYAGNEDHAEAEREHLRYCERVVNYETDARRGIQLMHRRGHEDWRGIAADTCPGMKPAE